MTMLAYYTFNYEDMLDRSVEGLLVIYVLNSGSLGVRSNLIQMS